MNKMHACFNKFDYSLIPGYTRVMLVVLLTLVWSSLAFCGEIHEAAESGDLAKVEALLKDNPALVSSRNNYGTTPLHLAVQEPNKEKVIALLSSGQLDLSLVLNRISPLAQWHEAFEEMHSGKIVKGVLTPQ